jgi:hypothetical protein
MILHRAIDTTITTFGDARPQSLKIDRIDLLQVELQAAIKS